MIAKKRILFILSFMLIMLWGYYLYSTGEVIEGPFIFNDEFTYFEFAKSFFFGRSLSSYTQYGPLYPFLISPFFSLANPKHTYEAIRIVNILIFLSTVIPGYLLARLLFSNAWLRILLPFCILICPFSGLVYLVWAEPLYYALFYWTCFIFCLHVKKTSILNSLTLGFFLALLYYTKPAAGLIVQIAAFLTLGFYTLYLANAKRSAATSFLIAILTCIALICVWMMHYIKLGVSIIGYPAATRGFSERVMSEGYGSILSSTLRGLFYQFSYFIIGTWSLIGVCLFMVLYRWKKLVNEERLLGLFLILITLGLIAISALGMASYSLDFKTPQGRYYSVLFPLVITFTLHLLIKPGLITKRMQILLIVIIVSTFIISIIASPLYVRSPLAFNSMPDLSPFIYISDKGLIVWRAAIDKPTWSLRINVPLFFSLFALLLCVFYRRKLTIPCAAILIALGMGFNAFVENRFITACGYLEIHDIYFNFLKGNIDIDKVAFDKNIGNMQIPFLTKIWMESYPRYLTVNEALHLNKQSNIIYFVSKSILDRREIYSSKYNTYKIYDLNYKGDNLSKIR